MLSILGHPSHFCDGVSRRGFLKIGGLSFGGASGFSLADLLRAEAASGQSNPHKAVINIFLAGGPPHQDLWDIKTEAPSEVRGEFKPIKTNVPGIEICEVFPKLAGLMDKAAVIRSVVGCGGGHDPYVCFSGWDNNQLKNIGGRPSIGSAVSKLFGPVDPSVPPNIGLAAPTQHSPWSDSGRSGFLGAAYSAFKPDGPGMQNMTLNGITLDRLADRRHLLSQMDSMRRDIDITGAMEGMDSFGQRALDVLTSSKLVDALDLAKKIRRSWSVTEMENLISTNMTVRQLATTNC